MCRSKMVTDASQPLPISPAGRSPRTPSSRRSSSRRVSQPSQTLRSPQLGSFPSTSTTDYSSTSGYRLDTSVATTSITSLTSLSSLRDSLPENAHIYDFSEIRSATNNFLAKRYSTSSMPCWRCTLRGKDAIIFQRKFRRTTQMSELLDKLASICRSHYSSIVKLLGASMSGNHIYLVYDFVSGTNLSDCLRNSRSPNFTVLSTWMSRMQVATDVAHGLDYIHNNSGLNIDLVHKYVKSSSVIVTEPSLNANICHFGAAELCGETVTGDWKAKKARLKNSISSGEIQEDDATEIRSELKRTDSRSRQFEGFRGYMSPEFQETGLATRESDVYAFGIIILELLSGEEPIRYRFDKARKEYRKISVAETATETVDGEDGEDGEGGGDGMEARVRKWIDRRLRDSFPVDVAEELTRVALECIRVDPDKRPNMRRVAGKISKLYLKSANWADQVKVPTDISVSWAPR